MATHFREEKSISRNTKWIPVAPDDILRSYEAKRSVCERNWTLFTALLPVIQSLRQTVRSDVRFTNDSFVWFVQTNERHKWIIRLSELVESFTKSDWSIWNSARFQQHRSYSDWKWAKIAAYLILWWMNSFSAPVPPTVIELRKQFDSNWRPMSLLYAQVWTEHLKGTKGELMKASLFTLYALDMQNPHFT